VQVYDHRRERSGYVRPAAVRRYELDEATAPRLAAIVEFLEDASGQESLGIGYVALTLRAAPPQAVGAGLFDALGTMAERLAARASARVGRGNDANVAAQIEVAESYGVHFVRFEEDEGHTRVCYDGEAFRRVLAAPVATPAARVHAALGATDPRCNDPTRGPSEALAIAKEQATALDAVDPSALGSDVPSGAIARLRVRRSAVRASIAYFAARTGDGPLAKQAAEMAKKELLLADRSTLSAEDRPAYEEAALRVSAVRWAGEAPAPAQGSAFDVTVAAGAPGQTCLHVKRRADPASAPASRAFEHCTYALVWPASIRVAPHDAAITMVTQPLAGWSELLVIRPTDAGFAEETLTPMTTDPELGYVELAGFSPDGARLLVVREARTTGPLGSPHTAPPSFHRSFEVVTTGALHVEKQASSLASCPTFRRWASAGWQQGTLALR
jgi:hypothetical protein